MKKSIKRILCGAMSLLMMSSVVVEHTYRAQANNFAGGESTVTRSLSFENVTGQYDTSKIVESNLNTSVLDAEKTSAPKYETRTVIVTLGGETLVDGANGTPLAEYASTWDGKQNADKIATEQDAFLRKLSKLGVEYKVVRTYDTLLNGVAIEVNTKHVKAIKNIEGVKSAVITTAYSEPKTFTTKNSEAGSGVVTNETEVYATGIYDSSAYTKEYGSGTVVAVLDTGLDYTHPAFQSFQTKGVDVAWDKEDVAKKLNAQNLVAEDRSGSLDANDVYVNAKVPFAYDYADDDPDVYPSYSNHGTHVAGIIGGYDTNGYTDKDGNPIAETFVGVVPDAQLAIFKVFTDDLEDPDIGGAVAEDIIAALEDCVMLGVDVINMSLGTSCGFTTTNDGDDEGEMLNAVYESIQKTGITLCAAASNDYSSGYGGTFGTNLSSNPDSGTVGSPSTFAASLSVASINGQKADYMVANADEDGNGTFVFYEESRDIDGNPFNFAKDMLAMNPTGEFEYVVVPGIGQAADYTSTIKGLFKDANGNSLNRIALIKRGDSTFQEKVEIAMRMGAVAVMVYNNVAGIIRMNLGEIEDPVPAVSLNMNAGNALVEGAKNRVGKITINEEYKAGPFMSEFSSWGPTHDLTLKPEITAHGGEITSTVPGGYGEQSGTSMASPNMAGFMAVVRSYIKKDLGITDPVEINRLAMQLTMSTAGTVYSQELDKETGLPKPYSPRKQGAGVAKLENVIETKAYLFTDVEVNDYRPKIELGDDEEREGVYKMSFKVKNFGKTTLTFSTDYQFMTETLASDGLAVSEEAYMLNDNAAEWTLNGDALTGEFSVKAGEIAEIGVTLSLSNKEKNYIEKSFENGMYVEGFLKLVSKTDSQCDLSIPFLGFYGNWEDAPMLDYTAYEVAESEQDASIKEEDKIKASVWATQPYSSYYNEKYILPMGGYVYLLPENDEPMYASEEYAAVSRYNTYYDEGNAENYMTSTSIKAVYAGLLRNARYVRYKMYNVATGELILEDHIDRVGKAYTGGGSAVPANVELEISPEAYGLAANGTYKMDFEFFMNTPEEGEVAPEENTYSFSFTVDYEAPILEDARIRYYNYKDGNKEKQRIYLDVDIYDNHYAQALLLCYPTVGEDGQTVLQLATDYPTPVRNPNRNGTTTVSVEITDIYDHICNEYSNQLYLQMDDYSINSCLYRVQIGEANGSKLPEGKDFALAEGEENVSVDIYGTHKVSLIYNTEVDPSNFLWTSKNPTIADVRNGEIVGLSAGTTEILVSNRKGDIYSIAVTVSDKQADTLASVPGISFNVIKNNNKALVKANGNVEVHAGEEFKLEILPDPWYHPMTDLRVVWGTSNESVATVDANGNVKTLKKGTASITAVVERKNGDKWEQTLYSALVILRVQNEFTVSNYTLTDYNGVGGVVTIPTDMNIWYIGEEAFKDNDNITKIIIPESVMQINSRAFMNCSALEEVYFISEEKLPIPTAKITLIYDQVFYNCPKLRKVDFSNTKTFTVANDCFAGCTSLKEVVAMTNIGTMHDRAFQGCTALTSVDLTGLHMSGSNVFEGCKRITEIKTGKFTAIGNYMFKDCVNLRGTLTLSTPKIGDGAFSGCVNLAGVRFTMNGDITIGASAFENCGRNCSTFTVDFGGLNVYSIGDRAFANSTLRTVPTINGLEVLGSNAFIGTYVNSVRASDVNLANVRLMGVPFENITVTAGTGYTERNGVVSKGDTLVYVNSSVTGELNVSSKMIAPYAFSDSQVTKVNISKDVTTIGVSAFENSSVRKVTFAAGSKISVIPAKAFYGSRLAEINLPASVTTVENSAFANSSIKTFTAEGLTEIKDGAFENAKALANVTLPETLKTMGNNVFSGCSSLKEISLPALETLGVYTFRGASVLEKVTFHADATTTGSYTFMGTRVKEVTLGEKVTKIEEGLFYQASAIESVTLPEGVTEIGANAFAETKKLTEVIGLDKVVIIGRQAFQNCALTTLNLDNAEIIEYGAFASEGRNGEDITASYTEVKMPAVKKIGALAFLNGNMASVELPASLTEIGYGAFTSADSLATLTVAADNANFFAEENVLYRYIDKTEGTYEILCYPAARVMEGDVKAYSIKEGTVLVQAYAFHGLKEGALNKVVLPYSVNAIGDSAFYKSGITEYTFESIQAPVLETIYRADVEQTIEDLATEATTAYYKGYYYANFDSYLLDYTQYGNKTSKLIINYPENGVGYDNHVYRTYFGVRNTTGIMMKDETRECINRINKMPSAEEIKSWNDWTVNAENKAKVEAFSNEVKLARLAYNNTMKDATQSDYVTSDLANKLLAVEAELRAVKAKFNITLKISSLEIAEGSKHKTEYKTGEIFSLDGLKLTVVYDDGSTEIADMSKVVLENNEALTKYDRYVTISYQGKTRRISITVSEEVATDSGKEKKGCSSVVVSSMAILTMLSASAIIYARKREN